MIAFVVLLHPDEPDSVKELKAAIDEQFPGKQHFKFSKHAYLITGADFTSDITEKIGMDSSDELYGAVFRLNGSYSGNSWVKLWEWLKAAEEVA